jgi:hypothetical protein
MKDTSMLLLLAILGTGLAVSAADAVMVARHPVHPPRPVDCRETTEVRVLSTVGGVIVVMRSPSDCRNVMPPVLRSI